jgi:hypothetical protein
MGKGIRVLFVFFVFGVGLFARDVGHKPLIFAADCEAIPVLEGACNFHGVAVFRSNENQQDISVSSPDGKVKIILSIADGFPTYSLCVGEQKPIAESFLGLKLDQEFGQNFRVLEQKTEEVFEEYEIVWWKNRKIENHYKEMVVRLESQDSKKYKLDLIFRAYNDGVAFRYRFPEQENLKEFTIEDDLTEFNFSGDYRWWSANGERENLGPLPLSGFSQPVFSPMVVKCADDLYMGIAEAAIYDFANFKFRKGSKDLSIECFLQGSSMAETGMQTSWRAIFIGKTPGDLIESNLMVNLNPESKIEDPSWIKTGKSMWDWRAWGYTAPDGFVYGLNTPSHKRFIDFAAENNIDFLLMDADWYGPEFSEESDPTKSNQEIDIEENFRYANAKGVGIILYLNDIGAKKFGLERVLKQFHEWGAVGVKYGFMSSGGQEKVLQTRKVIELCAKYKLVVNFHDNPIPPSGDARTWPNVITREYCHSQADAKRSYFPETAVSSVFINMLSGPVDMCNGWYGFDGNEVRPKVFEFIPGTVAAETAKLLVVFSGLSVLPDAPEEYNEKKDLFDFIANLPNQFDEYKVLGGSIDSYILVGRRSGENWYLGCLTNREARSIDVTLDFLKPGVSYQAFVYEDSPETHYMDNREAYQTRKIPVSSESKLTLKLAPGGGCAIRIIY